MLSDNDAFSLYIHIPYCIRKCPYCDFNSHVVTKIPEKNYTEALLRELEHYASNADWQGRTLRSIFFGGGTPSTFQPVSIARLLAAVAGSFPLDGRCEITLEANPGATDRNNFHGYRDGGVNRISLGVQSFQPHLLKFLGRVHSNHEARTALAAIRQVGFDNFSLDLIYANPGQTLTDLEMDLDAALSFDPPHLSAYNLTFEEGTPFHRDYRASKLHSLSESEEITMAELIETKVAGAGLTRYEISNYARPGFHSRHNVNYWRCGDYLGIGAGAHSCIKKDRSQLWSERWSNENDPARYMERVDASGVAVTDREAIDRAKAAGEFMFLGLRMTEGISLDVFHSRFDQAPGELFPRLTSLIEGGLIEEECGFLRLTPAGLLVANSIFVEFM